MSKLPPYDPLAVCRKCGSSDISTKYDFKRTPHARYPRRLDLSELTEWLERRCQCCDYFWQEACLSDEEYANAKETHEEHVRLEAQDAKRAPAIPTP